MRQLKRGVEVYEGELRRLAARLRHLRETLRMTRSRLAELAGINEDTVRRWEYGIHAFPAVHVLTLCRALGCTPNTLLGYEEGT